MLIHPFPPLFDTHSRVLILGSFPSVKSRDECFFYGHPQNRFWRVTAAVFDCPTPTTVPEKRAFLLEHGIALWDVIGSCEITGSADSSIRDVTVNDLSPILAATPIERIFVNGQTAAKYYNRFAAPLIGRGATVLPSTSPANAAWTLEKLTQAWSCIKPSE